MVLVDKIIFYMINIGKMQVKYIPFVFFWFESAI